MNDECDFYPEVRCLRVGLRVVKCEGCRHFKQFEREMVEEDMRELELIDEIRRKGKWSYTR